MKLNNSKHKQMSTPLGGSGVVKVNLKSFAMLPYSDWLERYTCDVESMGLTLVHDNRSSSVSQMFCCMACVSLLNFGRRPVSNTVVMYCAS